MNTTGSKRLADRVAVAERLASRRKPPAMTFADWAATAAYQATALVAAHEIKEGTPMQRLYAAICAGNLSGDQLSPIRACLWERFFWACYKVQEGQHRGQAKKWRTLGNWFNGRMSDDDSALYGWFIENLSEVCTEIIGPGENAAERRKSYRVEGGRLWLNGAPIDTPHLAAFGLEAARS